MSTSSWFASGGVCQRLDSALARLFLLQTREVIIANRQFVVVLLSIVLLLLLLVPSSLRAEPPWSPSLDRRSFLQFPLLPFTPIPTPPCPSFFSPVGSRATSFSALAQSIRYGLFCAPCNIVLNHCMSGHARRRTMCVAVRPCASSSTLHLSGDRVLRVGFLPYEPRARSLL